PSPSKSATRAPAPSRRASRRCRSSALRSRTRPVRSSSLDARKRCMPCLRTRPRNRSRRDESNGLPARTRRSTNTRRRRCFVSHVFAERREFLPSELRRPAEGERGPAVEAAFALRIPARGDRSLPHVLAVVLKKPRNDQPAAWLGVVRKARNELAQQPRV